MLCITNVARSIAQFFTTGMVRLNPNHLFGSRRYYRAGAAISSEYLKIIREDQAVLREIERVLLSHNHAMVQGAVVDNEVRLQAYGVIYGDVVGNHYVGLDCPHRSGVCTFLVSKTGPKELSIQEVLIPHREKHYDPYDVEFCWSMPLTSIEPCGFHTNPFTVKEC